MSELVASSRAFDDVGGERHVKVLERIGFVESTHRREPVGVKGSPDDGDPL